MMQNDKIRKMILISLFAAIAVVGSTFVSFPLGPARAFPVQHAINVIAAMMLGTGPGVLIAFLAALIRVIIGTGSLLAFPGGMIGAFLAGVLYKKFKKSWAAVTGEIIGTGLIASLFAVPYAKLLMGSEFGAFFFVPGFFFSSLSGAILGLLLVKQLQKTRAGNELQLMFAKKSTN